MDLVGKFEQICMFLNMFILVCSSVCICEMNIFPFIVQSMFVHSFKYIPMIMHIFKIYVFTKSVFSVHELDCRFVNIQIPNVRTIFRLGSYESDKFR